MHLLHGHLPYLEVQVQVPDCEIGSYIRRYWSGGSSSKYVLCPCPCDRTCRNIGFFCIRYLRCLGRWKLVHR